MKITELESFPPKENPFWHDAFHMGHYLGKNVCAMFKEFEHEHQNYIILIDMTTGKRIRVEFTPDIPK